MCKSHRQIFTWWYAVFGASINDWLQYAVQFAETDMVVFCHHLDCLHLSLAHQLVDFSLLLLNQHLKHLHSVKTDPFINKTIFRYTTDTKN